MRLLSKPRRRGANLVEFGVVFPMLMVLVAGLAVCGMLLSAYQQAAYLAREGARFASVHAGVYKTENATAISQGTLPDVTSSYIATNVVQAQAVNLDPTQLQVTVTFNTSAGSFSWDDTANNGNRMPYSTKSTNGTTYNVTNTVSVTISYQYVPVWYLTAPVTVTSTSVMPVCY
jgi:Flp pilus assembly protein TadG